MCSTSYPSNAEDWQGRFIANMAAGLGRQSDIELVLWAPPGDLPPGVESATTANDRYWLSALAKRGGIAHLIRQNKICAAKSVFGLLRRLRTVYRCYQPDVIHVNWLQNALPLWGTKTPIVVNVLGTDFRLLRLPGMRSLLRAVFKQRRTILAPNAEWMKPGLEEAFGDVAKIQSVPFGVDMQWFRLQRKFTSKTPQWLAVTRLTKNKIGDLFEWGEGLFGEHRILHLFGPMQEQVTLPAWVRYHGPTHPAELIASWFPVACGLITLSRHDEGRPQMILESMAAGLPVIASNLPGHRDVIHHQKTGWLTSSPTDFASALNLFEQPEHNLQIGTAGRDWVQHNIGTWDDCARRYVMLYEILLESQS